MAVTVANKEKKGIDNEILLVIFLMLLVVALPLAISILDIGTPIPGYQSNS